MAREKVDIHVLLHDRASRPAKRVEDSLEGIEDAARDAHREVNKLETELDALSKKNIELEDKLADINDRFEKLDALLLRTQKSSRKFTSRWDRFNNTLSRGKDVLRGYFTSLKMLDVLFTDMAAMLPILGTGLQALGAGAIALTGSLGRMTKGFAVAIPALASFVQYVTIGSMAVKALMDDNIKLSKSGMALRRHLKDIKWHYRDLGKEAANAMAGFKTKDGKNLGDSLHNLARNYEKLIRAVNVSTAESIAKIGIHFAGIFDTNEMRGYFKSMSKETTAAGENFGKAFANIMGGMLKVGTAAAPTLTRFSEWFEKSTGNWMKNINVEKMAQSIAEAGDQMAGFWEGTKSLGRGIGGIMKASKGLGDWMSGGMKDGLANWAEKVNSKEGQESLARFFEGQKENLSAIGGVLSSAWEAFKGIDSKNFVAFMKTVEEGMPQIANLINSIDEHVLPGIIGIADKLNQVDFSAAQKAVGTFVGIIDTLLGAILQIDDVGGSLGTGLAKGLNYIPGVDIDPEGFGATIKGFLSSLGGIATAAGLFYIAMNKLTGGLVGVLAGKGLGLLGKGFSAFRGLLPGGKGGKNPKAPKKPNSKLPAGTNSDETRASRRSKPSFKDRMRNLGKKGGRAGIILGGAGLAIGGIASLFGGGGDEQYYSDSGYSGGIGTDSVYITANNVFINGDVGSGTASYGQTSAGGMDASEITKAEPAIMAALGLTSGIATALVEWKGKGGLKGFFNAMKPSTGGILGKGGLSLKNLKNVKGGVIGSVLSWVLGDQLIAGGNKMAASRDGSAKGASRATFGSMLSGGTNAGLWGSTLGLFGPLAGLVGTLGGTAIGGTGAGLSNISKNLEDVNKSSEQMRDAQERTAKILKGTATLTGGVNSKNGFLGNVASGLLSPLGKLGTMFAGFNAATFSSLVPGRDSNSGPSGRFMKSPPREAPRAPAAPMSAPSGGSKVPAAKDFDISGIISRVGNALSLLGGIDTKISGVMTNADAAINKMTALRAAVAAVPTTVNISVNANTGPAQAAINGLIMRNARRAINIAVGIMGNVLSPKAPQRPQIGMATGGVVSPGMDVLIGERGAEGYLTKSGKFSMIGTNGPEMMNFREPGYVIPNHMVSNPEYRKALAGGGGTDPALAQAMLSRNNENFSVGKISVNIKGDVKSDVDIERAVLRAIKKAEKARNERR